MEGQAKSWSQTFKVEKPVLLSTSCMSFRKSFNASELLKLPEKRYEQYLHYSVLWRDTSDRSSWTQSSHLLKIMVFFIYQKVSGSANTVLPDSSLILYSDMKNSWVCSIHIMHSLVFLNKRQLTVREMKVTKITYNIYVR